MFYLFWKNKEKVTAVSSRHSTAKNPTSSFLLNFLILAIRGDQHRKKILFSLENPFL